MKVLEGVLERLVLEPNVFGEVVWRGIRPVVSLELVSPDFKSGPSGFVELAPATTASMNLFPCLENSDIVRLGASGSGLSNSGVGSRVIGAPLLAGGL